ncbi:MAG: hypothetical protein FVQ77_16345 [Cytophagales bacterium]|nr:hypothetical protein [Cytophagales bacterium]
MKEILVCLFTILLLSTGCGCKKDPPILLCPEGYVEVDNIQIIDLGCCFYDSIEYIINNDSTYQAVFQPFIDYDSTYILFDIDFIKYTLLGKYMEGTCSEDFYSKKICKNDANKQYRYTVKLTGKGPICEMLFHTMNWVIVPKVPDDYYVKFDISDY